MGHSKSNISGIEILFLILLKFGGAVDTIETSNNPDFHPNRTTPSFLAPSQSLSFFVKIVNNLLEYLGNHKSQKVDPGLILKKIRRKIDWLYQLLDYKIISLFCANEYFC